MKKIVLLCSFFLIFVTGFSIAQSSNYYIANKWSIPGEGGWDLLTSDDAANRLYISHGTMVQVIDCKTGSVLGTISDLKGVHGIAVAPKYNKGFISCGRDTSVVVFNLKTFEITDRIKITGINPDAIIYDPYSKNIFNFNGNSNDVTVIDAKSNKVIKTIQLAGKPELPVIDGKGKLFLNLEDKSEVTSINTNKLLVEKTWSVDPGEEPTGLAIDIMNNRLFSVCSNNLMVVSNAKTGVVITTLPIGKGPDGADFDPKYKRAYSSNGEGTLTVVQEGSKDNYTVLEIFATQKGARTIAVNKKTHHIYMQSAEYDPAPEKTSDNPNPRPKIRPGTFVILDIVPVK